VSTLEFGKNIIKLQKPSDEPNGKDVLALTGA